MNELAGRGNSPPGTGGVAAPPRKCREASFEGADGVVILAELTTPAAPAKVAFGDFLLMARPPLLYQEGNIPDFPISFTASMTVTEFHSYTALTTGLVFDLKPTSAIE